jgi:hypothetical protein
MRAKILFMRQRLICDREMDLGHGWCKHASDKGPRDPDTWESLKTILVSWGWGCEWLTVICEADKVMHLLSSQPLYLLNVLAKEIHTETRISMNKLVGLKL